MPNSKNPPQQYGPARSFQRSIERIHDHLYANSHVKTPTAIFLEFGKIFHTALYVEEVLGRRPAFQIPPREAKILLENGNLLREAFLSQLANEYAEMNSAWNLYPKEEMLLLSPFDTCFVCVELSGTLLSDHSKDLLGDATEVFRSVIVKRVGGQFFTDPIVTRLAMTLLQFDPRSGDDLVDICAGTGGFLLAGLNHIRYLASTNAPDLDESSVIKLASKSLKGRELDIEVCDAANASLRSRLGVVDAKPVQCGDSLAIDAFTDKAGRIRLNQHLCAASNPPFGTKITVKDPEILEQFELSRLSGLTGTETSSVSPTPPDILFLERNIQILKPGSGRLAIVLPYQLLSGPKAINVRKWLLRNARVLAVIDLPSETFQPHTGTKTALLIVERRRKPLEVLKADGAGDVFMATPQWIGHDRRGNPVYMRTPDGKLSDRLLCDFQDVDDAFAVFLDGGNPSEKSSNCFRVPLHHVLSDPLLRINAQYHRPSRSVTADWYEQLAARGWRFVELGELVREVFFPGRFKRHYVEAGEGAVPFLGGANITDFIARTDKWLSLDDPKLSKLRVESGWILVTRSGTTGLVSSVPESWNGFAMSEHIIRVIPDPNKMSAEYLLAFLQSRFGQEQLAKGVFGSVIDEITPEHISQLKVPLPPESDIVKAVSDSMRQAEMHRQMGIAAFDDAVNRIESLLQRDQ